MPGPNAAELVSSAVLSHVALRLAARIRSTAPASAMLAIKLIELNPNASASTPPSPDPSAPASAIAPNTQPEASEARTDAAHTPSG